MRPSATTRTHRGRPPDQTAVRSGAAFVTILTGQGAGVIVALRRARTLVGRGDNADLRLLGAVVSRNHAQLALEPDGLVKLTDINSSNGTYLNGVMVRSEILRDGDRVSFGGGVVLDIRYGLRDEEGAANEPVGEAREIGAPEDASGMHAIAMPDEPRFDHRIRTYERLVSIRRRRLGIASPSLAVSLDCAGSLYRQAGDAERAVVCHREALKLCESASFVTPLERAHTTVRLVRALVRVGEHGKAQAGMEEALRLFRASEVQIGERTDFHIASGELLAVTDPRQLRRVEADARSELAEMGAQTQFCSIKSALFDREWSELSIRRARMADPL